MNVGSMGRSETSCTRKDLRKNVMYSNTTILERRFFVTCVNVDIHVAGLSQMLKLHGNTTKGGIKRSRKS